jgi:hypothetical protein
LMSHVLLKADQSSSVNLSLKFSLISFCSLWATSSGNIVDFDRGQNAEDIRAFEFLRDVDPWSDSWWNRSAAFLRSTGDEGNDWLRLS